jgi:hypothetical protein
VLDRLEADDLIEAAQRLAMLFELTQVKRAKVDRVDPQQLGPPARILLLARGERGGEHAVARAGGVDAEGSVPASGIEGPRRSLA